jgi:hypothetical protein
VMPPIKKINMSKVFFIRIVYMNNLRKIYEFLVEVFHYTFFTL